MAPRKNYSLLILQLSLESSIDPKHSQMTMTQRPNPPTLPDVQGHFLNRILNKEWKQLPRDAKVVYTNWQLTTGDESLFKIGGGAFDSLFVIFGEESIYSLFYETNSRCSRVVNLKIAPASELGLSYCDCCLDTQYLNIIDRIKNHNQNKNK